MALELGRPALLTPASRHLQGATNDDLAKELPEVTMVDIAQAINSLLSVSAVAGGARACLIDCLLCALCIITDAVGIWKGETRRGASCGTRRRPASGPCRP